MEKIELINLTLDEIRRAASVVENVRIHAKFHGCVKKDDPILKEMIEDCNKALDDCRLALRDVLENIAEFLNGSDAVSSVDMALTQVPFDLIYERKTEDDYE